ncbi:MAG: hypothetical protein ACRDZ8_11400 [Acidimicrobiales bacterium]
MTEPISVVDGRWPDEGLDADGVGWDSAPAVVQGWPFRDVNDAFAGLAGQALEEAPEDEDDEAAEPDDEHPADFRASAVRLARAKPRTNQAIKAAREAAQALRDLADARNDAALRQYLRPDPEQADATWTVACYQIGDLTPCTLKDFASPVTAMRNLADCGQASHLAAELVASTPSGTRWTAVLRTADQLSFQLPNDQSAATGADSGSAVAASHWRQQLARWEAATVDGSDAGRASTKAGSTKAASAKAASAKAASTKAGSAKSAPAKPASAKGGSATPQAARPPRPTKVPPAPAPAPAPSSDSLELERALEMVVATLHRVEVNARSAEHPDALVLSRLDALDRRMSEFEVAFEAVLDRRIHALARYTAELTRTVTAQQQAINAQLEARLTELMAYLPRPLGPVADGPVVDLPVVDLPVVDGPVVDGPVASDVLASGEPAVAQSTPDQPEAVGPADDTTSRAR